MMNDRRIKRGTIRRVRMHNFLTFDDCEVFPGPKLNVVIGPNGSGKSSMTHAICLACAGTPEQIGRTSQLSYFVKLGTPPGQQTFVEVDLYESADKIVTIRRVINGENNSSVWYINGTQKKLSDVKLVVSAFAIDVDNLCSFMPQDRVGQFSSYNGKEILQNTLKSIRSPADEVNLFEEQTELSNLEQLRERSRMDRDAVQKKYDDSRRELESLQSELQRLERRKDAMLKLKLLKVKWAFVQCNNAKNIHDANDEALQQLQNELATKKLALKPLELELQRYQKALEKLTKGAAIADKKGKLSNNSSSSSNNNSSSKNNSAISIQQQSKATTDKLNILPGEHRIRDEAVEEAAAEMSTIEARRVEETKKMEKLQREIAHVAKKLEEVEAELPGLEAQNRSNTEQLTVITRQAADLDAHRSEQQRIMQEQQQLVARLTRDLENVKDNRQIYRQKLIQSNHHQAMEVVRVMDWMDEHLVSLKERGLVRGEIHGPVGMLITVQDPAYAAMVEKVLGNVRGYAFLVENDEDFKFLKREFSDRLRVKINVYNVENFQVLNQPRVYHAQQIHHFQRFGVMGYLSDQVQCSDIVRAYLYSFTNLHASLCGKSERDTLGNAEFSALSENPHRAFRLFMQLTTQQAQRRHSYGAGQYEGSIVDITGKRSRFNASAPPSISSSTVPPGKGLVSGYDNSSSGNGNASDANDFQKRRQALEEEIHQANLVIRRCNESIAQTKQQRCNLDTEKGVLQRFRATYTQKKNEPLQYKRKLQDLQTLCDDCQRKLTHDVDAIKAKQRTKYVQEMDALLLSLTQGLSLVEQSLALLPEKSVSKMKSTVLEDMISKTMTQLDEAQLSLVSLQKQIERKLIDCKQSLRVFEEKEKALEEMMLAEGDADTFMNDVFPKAQAICTSDNEREIETLIIETEAEINAIVDNPGLVTRQQTLVTTLSELSTRLETYDAEHAQAETSLSRRKEQWLTSIRALQSKLHLIFQQYMRELHFDGEILLREQGSFLDYELVLMVKFRQEAPLTALSAQKHSGGERAVSTIMFLMALQDMTQSPFRVVDEINQGMDERNERLVFDRIVRNCCGDWTPTTTTSNNEKRKSLTSKKRPLPIEGDTDEEDEDTDSIHHDTRDTAGTQVKYVPQWRPQYFLVTPKLLPNLVSLKHPDITVLLVRSGAGLRDNHWNFSNVVDKYLQQIGATPLPVRPRLNVTAATYNNVQPINNNSSSSSSSSNSSGHKNANASSSNDWLNSPTAAAINNNNSSSSAAAAVSSSSTSLPKGTKASTMTAILNAKAAATSSSSSTSNAVKLEKSSTSASDISDKTNNPNNTAVPIPSSSSSSSEAQTAAPAPTGRGTKRKTAAPATAVSTSAPAASVDAELVSRTNSKTTRKNSKPVVKAEPVAAVSRENEINTKINTVSSDIDVIDLSADDIDLDNTLATNHKRPRIVAHDHQTLQTNENDLNSTNNNNHNSHTNSGALGMTAPVAVKAETVGDKATTTTATAAKTRSRRVVEAVIDLT